MVGDSVFGCCVQEMCDTCSRRDSSVTCFEPGHIRFCFGSLHSTADIKVHLQVRMGRRWHVHVTCCSTSRLSIGNYLYSYEGAVYWLRRQFLIIPLIVLLQLSKFVFEISRVEWGTDWQLFSGFGRNWSWFTHPQRWANCVLLPSKWCSTLKPSQINHYPDVLLSTSDILHRTRFGESFCFSFLPSDLSRPQVPNRCLGYPICQSLFGRAICDFNPSSEKPDFLELDGIV